MKGVILHIHEIIRSRCRNLTETRMRDIDLPLYSIASVTPTEDEALPVMSFADRVAAVSVTTAKNDVVVSWSDEEQRKDDCPADSRYSPGKEELHGKHFRHYLWRGQRGSRNANGKSI